MLVCHFNSSLIFMVRKHFEETEALIHASSAHGSAPVVIDIGVSHIVKKINLFCFLFGNGRVGGKKC